MRGKRPSLACLGDLMLDVVVRAEADVEAGTDVPGSVRFRAGGSAANTARAFALAGGEAIFLGAVGDDAMGRRLAASLRTAGVTVHAPRVRGRTGRLLALVEPAGERSFVTDRGVADALSPRLIKRSWLTRVQALHLPAYSLLTPPLSDTAYEAAQQVRRRGGVVSVDLASRRPLLAHGRRAAHEAIGRVQPDVILGNDAEAAALLGERHVEWLLELAPSVVVKQGAGGCRLLWRSGDPSSPAGHSTVATRSLAVTDTTGAGDAFDAGFLYALLAGGHRRDVAVGASLLRRAALAGHRAAARLLRGPRTELVL